MPGTKWTKEQSEAINSRNCNLLVAAGAGAGKTAVLVERIIRRIMDENDPVDIDNLLVVTFTNAAASEMRERIGEAISKELDKNPENRRLQTQLTLLNKSNIMTIHSFCLQVIRNNFHCIDLDPNFRIADETEGILLKSEVLEELFDDMYKEDNVTDDFLQLVDAFGGKDDKKVQDMILNVYRFAESSPWPEKWLRDSAEQFNLDENYNFGETKWAEILMEDVNIELQGCKDKLEKSIEMIKDSPGLEYYMPVFIEDLGNINDLIHAKDFDELTYKFTNIEFSKLPGKKSKDVDTSVKEYVKKQRDEVKKKITELKESIFLNLSNNNKDLKYMYPMMKCLSYLVSEFKRRYSVKKRERLIIDFNDIEHFALNILTELDSHGYIKPSSAALEYRKKFEEIFVDEYQDSNLVQEVLLNMVARIDVSGKWLLDEEYKSTCNHDDISVTENAAQNMFMVGDVKQSIYKFRQAKPELFLEKYNNYSEERGAENRRIKLFRNFRSREEIINGVNFIFKQIMSENIGELNYNSEEELIPSADYPIDKEAEKDSVYGGEIQVDIIEKNKTDISNQDTDEEQKDDMEDEETLDNIQLEARLAADRINDIINGSNGMPMKVYDKSTGKYRFAKYKDIVILMRSTKDYSKTFTEELTKKNIPVFADTNSGYFETVEVKTMISLLQIIDNPYQDIPLLSVLRSPISFLSAEELIDIRNVDFDKSIYENMLAICNEENLCSDELKDKVQSFIAKLKQWRNDSLHTALDEFIWKLYTETGYYGFIGALPGGMQRQANLRILFQRAKEFEKTSLKGLFNFVNFIDKLKKNSGDMGSAKILGENENVVRIMSIHKSKGLEFPVVILSACGKRFNFMDLNSSLLLHQDLGYGPDFIDIKRRVSYPTIYKSIMRKKIKLELIAEEMRILYVAFTRAKEKLIITGMVSNVEGKCRQWASISNSTEEKISEYDILNSKCYLDWIGLALVRHTDGTVLRSKGGKKDFKHLIDDKSKWKIKIWNKEQFLNTAESPAEEEHVENQLENLLKVKNEVYFEEVNRRLKWEYKYVKSSNIPAKLSVSEIKRRFQVIDDTDSSSLISPIEFRKPGFLENTKKFTASERGTILHLVMQHLDINKVSSKEEIQQQLIHLINKQFITEEQSKIVNINNIFKFYQSDIGKRIKKAHKIYREQPFYIKVPSTSLYNDLDMETYKDEEILIQGIIDCYFEENDGLVLLDYKTDYVEDEQQIIEKYKIQIQYYAKALEVITGKTVKEKYIYLFYNGNLISF
ncbi:helicase-exonuclease AddAB subunit AddA [Clostridium sp. JN-9]|uniref:helicase-exonuclease AddAB subunit AddA n=1 Tax=Clostridium sp. JN-9 TaxID=2507159 RepID=UPI000FFE040B|nr:helicase-exonuclease AddAB subunit AddA [Clostridium sp. JN-9]QAT39445.1 helicase-exonuclease AddAB subunit AddA [Clostridium sp. JN-9]